MVKHVDSIEIQGDRMVLKPYRIDARLKHLILFRIRLRNGETEIIEQIFKLESQD